jgi:hypothetical protein
VEHLRDEQTDSCPQRPKRTVAFGGTCTARRRWRCGFLVLIRRACDLRVKVVAEVFDFVLRDGCDPGAHRAERVC